jgi:hypothetical protein
VKWSGDASPGRAPRRERRYGIVTRKALPSFGRASATATSPLFSRSRKRDGRLKPTATKPMTARPRRGLPLESQVAPCRPRGCRPGTARYSGPPPGGQAVHKSAFPQDGKIAANPYQIRLRPTFRSLATALFTPVDNLVYGRLERREALCRLGPASDSLPEANQGCPASCASLAPASIVAKVGAMRPRRTPPLAPRKFSTQCDTTL